MFKSPGALDPCRDPAGPSTAGVPSRHPRGSFRLISRAITADRGAFGRSEKAARHGSRRAILGGVKVMLIVNPTAGSGAGGRIGPEVARALEAQGTEVSLE